MRTTSRGRLTLTELHSYKHRPRMTVYRLYTRCVKEDYSTIRGSSSKLPADITSLVTRQLSMIARDSPLSRMPQSVQFWPRQANKEVGCWPLCTRTRDASSCHVSIFWRKCTWTDLSRELS